MPRYAIGDVRPPLPVSALRARNSGKQERAWREEGLFLVATWPGEIFCRVRALEVDLDDKLDRDVDSVRNRKLPRRCAVREASNKERWKMCSYFSRGKRETAW